MIPACKEIRKNILRISKVSGHGHLPTCFSVVEILYAVYGTLKHKSGIQLWEDEDSDIFILSKGHAALAHYCVLSRFGYLLLEEVNSFGNFLSYLGCHADRLKVPGVEVSTGSLGHGIGVAVGMALGLKIQKSSKKVIVLIGDGEANEGSVWEAIMVAVDLNLNNLTVIYDGNLSQLRCLHISNPAERFKAFGCDALEINGHDVCELREALSQSSNFVKVIVANTKKGYGCRTLVENQYEWHRKSPNDAEFKTLMEELDAETV